MEAIVGYLGIKSEDHRKQNLKEMYHENSFGDLP